MVKPLHWKLLIVLILSLLVSCRPAEPTPVPISTFADPDQAFQKAVRQAQDTLHVLRQAFLAPKPSYTLMSLKVRFRSDESIEDMWTVPIDLVDGVYTVQMVEGVTLEKGLHPERLVEVSPKNIIDWMILEKDGTVIGGYTLRLEYERLSPEEQEKYYERTGYKFE